ncbi:MAG: SCP2 sterol-binding domain-containing protein [Pseudomonadota bacterium]
MSDVVNMAMAALNERLSGGFDGSVKFVIRNEGTMVIDATGAHAGDQEADCVLTADADTFRSLLSGDLNPATAFMTGKLHVDGDIGVAMQLGAIIG